jgi:hypothetical protein
MRSSSNGARTLLYCGLLRSAGLLVPAAQREEWGREWRGELWHVRKACAPLSAPSWQGEREVCAFCLGAFQDAICLRRASLRSMRPFSAMDGSARQCVLFLAAVLVSSYAIALLLPGVRAERSLWPRKATQDLVVIEESAASDDAHPTISFRQFTAWTARRQKYFDGFAFYRITRETVDTESLSNKERGRTTWTVARASANLFPLMGLPVRFGYSGIATSEGFPEIVLGEARWKRQFGANPHIAGTMVHFGTRMFRVAGVIPDGSLALPGAVDAWLLEPAAAFEEGTAGFVIAHLTALGKAEMWASRVHITENMPGVADEDLLGVSLEEWGPTPSTLYLFALILALLALPAITTVSLGESSVNPQKTSWSTRLNRWSFFGVKIALILPVVYFVSLDLAYGFTTLGRERAAYVQLVSTFAMSLFGLRWALKDQRQRCPVCLRRVTHPAHVGQASRTFLDWNGTEMICMGGHTLLHVPSLPTSWFGGQRWLYLDTSWNFLFAEPTQPIL